MTDEDPADVVVLGAGPAGCTAAFRLLAQGHRVVVVEKQAFPRPRVGEALSAGVAGLLQFLGLGDVIDSVPCLRSVPTRIAWERRRPELVAAAQHHGGIVVDRAEFDARLLERVRGAGGRIYQPAEVLRIDGEPGQWRVWLSGCGVSARLVLDARGRGGHARSQIPTAPQTVALWTHAPGAAVSPEARLEATRTGGCGEHPCRAVTIA